ncbi:hypothetical protein PoB_005906500 [Plakobranchus ocellatus]|uniref:Uncharacterized protein n=1 Tax=Plakobranchus ocellatus TaxID=259542 RepID=A0AAV4CI84_9GAST|nr:hypothetical protein PoB_005906500 [Plakobranchus ocellatus]
MAELEPATEGPCRHQVPVNLATVPSTSPRKYDKNSASTAPPATPPVFSLQRDPNLDSNPRPDTASRRLRKLVNKGIRPCLCVT